MQKLIAVFLFSTLVLTTNAFLFSSLGLSGGGGGCSCVPSSPCASSPICGQSSSCGGSQFCGQSYSAQQYSAPQYAASQYSAPQYSAPQYFAPQPQSGGYNVQPYVPQQQQGFSAGSYSAGPQSLTSLQLPIGQQSYQQQPQSSGSYSSGSQNLPSNLPTVQQSQSFPPFSFALQQQTPYSYRQPEQVNPQPQQPQIQVQPTQVVLHQEEHHKPEQIVPQQQTSVVTQQQEYREPKQVPDVPQQQVQEQQTSVVTQQQEYHEPEQAPVVPQQQIQKEYHAEQNQVVLKQQVNQVQEQVQTQVSSQQQESNFIGQYEQESASPAIVQPVALPAPPQALKPEQANVLPISQQAIVVEPSSHNAVQTSVSVAPEHSEDSVYKNIDTEKRNDQQPGYNAKALAAVNIKESSSKISAEALEESETKESSTVNLGSKCNSELMHTLMTENIHESPSQAKRQIQKSVTTEIGGKVDVICSTGIFSYIVNTELYCEIEKNGVTCLAFRQSV